MRERAIVFFGCLVFAWCGMLEAFPVVTAGLVAAAFALLVVVVLAVVGDE